MQQYLGGREAVQGDGPLQLGHEVEVQRYYETVHLQVVLLYQALHRLRLVQHYLVDQTPIIITTLLVRRRPIGIPLERLNNRHTVAQTDVAQRLPAEGLARAKEMRLLLTLKARIADHELEVVHSHILYLLEYLEKDVLCLLVIELLNALVYDSAFDLDRHHKVEVVFVQEVVVELLVAKLQDVG